MWDYQALRADRPRDPEERGRPRSSGHDAGPRKPRHGGLLLAIAVVATLTACSTVSPPPFPRSTAPFLGPTDFSASGTYDPRPGNASAYGEATYHGNIVFTNLARNLVEAILPPGLQLAQNATLPTLHPVIYMYGRPHNTHWVIADMPITPGPNYQELILVIPFVQASGGTKWHNFVGRMYLDDIVAIAIGNLFFGYAKEAGTSVETGTQISESVAGTPYFHADIQPTAAWMTNAQAQGSLPNYLAIQTILNMPMVGQAPWDDLICSYFELHYTNAQVAPADSNHRFLQPFRPGMAPWVALGMLASVPNGAIAIRDLNWRIKQPGSEPSRCRF